MGNERKDEWDTHRIYWERLGTAAPGDVSRRTGAIFNEEKKGYVLPVLNQKYLVLPGEKKILCMRGDFCEEEKLRDYFFLMVLLYLLNAAEGDPTRTWISEKELKGGTTFFRGPHALRTEELKERFGSDPEGFFRAGARLGGVELLFGDKAFALAVLPKVPLGYILWKGDSEFPPSISVLFDSTIQNHFSLDGIWCIVAEVTQRLLEAAGEP